MAGTRLFKFFTAVNAMALAVVGYANAEDVATHKVVALRSGGGGLYGLFQSNSELSAAFTDALPGPPINGTTPGTGGNGNITIIDSMVDDTVLWGGADTDGSGIPAEGGNSWDEPESFYRNFGASPISLSAAGGPRMSLLKFDVSQAGGLSGGTIAKAELRLFFDGGAGPGDLFGFRDFDDKVGRITTVDWVEGNKDAVFPGADVTDPNGVILISGAPGVSRAHPNSTNTGEFQDINNDSRRARRAWADGTSGNLLRSDYNSNGIVDGGDLSIWESNYGSQKSPFNGLPLPFENGNDDLDLDVDGRDFLVWQRNSGKVGLLVDPNGDIENDQVGWFSTVIKGGGAPFQAPTWGDGNDYFNPDPVDYRSNPDFPWVEAVGMYAPRPTGTGGNANGVYPVSPLDGVSPGDGDPNTETNSEDSSSLGFLNNFDYSGGFSELDPNGDVGTQAGFDVWDITAIVQAWADGADNFGLYVRDNLREFSMSETPHGLDFAPVLFIEYTTAGAVAASAAVPEPSNIVLLGLAGLAGLVRRRRRALGLTRPR